MNIGIIIAVVLTLAVAVPVTWYITSSNHRKQDEIKVDSADARARTIIDEALREAESKKREAMLEIRTRYCRNAVVKGFNMLKGATTIERNGQIGGHNAGL